MHTLGFGALGLLLAAGSIGAQPALTFETARAAIAINPDGTWASLTERSAQRECLPDGAGQKLADIRVDGKTCPVQSVSRADGGVRLTFEGTDTQLQYDVEPGEDWVVFRLRSLKGPRPDRLTLLRVPVGITSHVGRRLNAAWDDETTVCLMAANRQADCGASGGKIAVLGAATQDFPGPRLEGAAVALILCPTPRFKAIARKASHEFGLLINEDPQGTPVKDTDLVRGSYWFLSFGADEVDRVIDYCHRAGIKQVMMGSGSWCAKVGHYLFNARYPNGVEGLKATVDKLHAAGILVGMHTFVSKISKTDPYVTPVPDKRFWHRFETTLDDDVTADQTQITVAGDLSQWAGSPKSAQQYWEGGVAKHREVVIGNEIIQYDMIGPEGVWDTFLGCKRGAWGTTASAHQAGADAVHYGVDGCINGYIIDQETDLIDEVAQRIAGIFNYCGFDMVYFDGGEDVDRRRYNYYVSNFQAQAMSRFSKRPIIHMGTVMTHLLWHSFARSSTVDTYLNTLGGAIVGGKAPTAWPTVKAHINKSVRYMLSMQANMVPGELGWFGIWPAGTRSYTLPLSPEEYDDYTAKGYDEPVVTRAECTTSTAQLDDSAGLQVKVAYDGLQLDEMEYLMCKSLAYDVPVSLQTSFSSMEHHPLTPEILRIFSQYETRRLARAVPQDTLTRLQELDKDHALIAWQGATRFVRVQRIPKVADDYDVRAMVGQMLSGSVATIWHVSRDCRVTIDIAPTEISVVDIEGHKLEHSTEDGKAVIPVDQLRRTIVAPRVAAEELFAALQTATVWVRPPATVYVDAADFVDLQGQMSKGADAGVTEPDAHGDVVVCTGRPDRAAPQGWYAEYTAQIPHAGVWYVWARVRYPSGGDDSFGLVLPGQEVTLSGDQVLGNCGVNHKKWHWTGRGGGSTTVPPGQEISLKLEEGPFTFRIYAREGPGTAQMNPRLDMICLSDEPAFTPNDEAPGARAE